MNPASLVQTDERSRIHGADRLSPCDTKEIAGVSGVNPDSGRRSREAAQEWTKGAVSAYERSVKRSVVRRGGCTLKGAPTAAKVQSSLRSGVGLPGSDKVGSRNYPAPEYVADPPMLRTEHRQIFREGH